jgi:glycosyltransferase involved in cell wall biosynthesis
MEPRVTFVVPCYKLAHLLTECVNSILAQTYSNFEILVMDDCSPDNTPEVAASFGDPRVKHIRNEPNLGHLRNYNKGIGLAEGKYVWLISADDCLRQPHALARYVQVLESHPEVGYAFCPAMKIRNGQEAGICDYSVHGNSDRIFQGRRFLEKLIYANTIVAASGLVRKECYDKVSLFPLDMPWGGDWYLWSVFALYWDVAYIAEPMVCYREHELSMTNLLMDNDLHACSSDDITIPWIIKRKADEAGHRDVSRKCLDAIAAEYARHVASKRYRTSTTSAMTLEQFEDSLKENTPLEKEREWVRARVFARIADIHYWQEEYSLARRFYYAGLRKDPLMAGVWTKWLLLQSGDLGNRLRKRRSQFYRAAS